MTTPPRIEGGTLVRALRTWLFGSVATADRLAVALALDPAGANRPTRLAQSLPLTIPDDDHDHDLDPHGPEAENLDAGRSMAELSLSFLELPGRDATRALDRMSLSGSGSRESWPRGEASELVDALDRLC